MNYNLSFNVAVVTRSCLNPDSTTATSKTLTICIISVIYNMTGVSYDIFIVELKMNEICHPFSWRLLHSTK